MGNKHAAVSPQASGPICAELEKAVDRQQATVRVPNQSSLKMTERKKHRRLHQVENFAVSIYNTFNTHESIKLLLTSQMAKEALYHFAEGEKADNLLYMYEYAQGVLDSKHRPTKQMLLHHFNYLVSLYVNPCSPSEINFSDALRNECMTFFDAMQPKSPDAQPRQPFQPSNAGVILSEIDDEKPESVKSVSHASALDSALQQLPSVKLTLSAKVNKASRIRTNVTALSNLSNTNINDIDVMCRIYDMLDKLCYEALEIISQDYFNKFLNSKHYSHWRTSEYSHASAATMEDTTTAMEHKKQIERGGVDLGSPMSTHTRRALSRRLSDFSMRAFITMDVDELNNLLVVGNWIASFLSLAEALPVGISLASASEDRKGFPLLFVNKAFEKMTGYRKCDVVGDNCKFLQCEATEMDIVAELSAALRDGKPITRILHNRSQNGEIFKNLLSLKPVRDDNNKYCYVIGTNVNLSSYNLEDENESDLIMMLSQIMLKLPDCIMLD